MKKRWSLIMFIILLTTLLAACAEEDDTSSEEEEERVVTVEVAEVEEKDMTVERSVFGRTAPNSSTPIMVQTPGEVDELEVEDGEQVEEDDILVRLSTPAGKQNIRASKDGEIINLQVSEGDMASTEEPIAMIADLDTVKVQFSVTADVRSLISLEDTVDTRIDGEEYEATITKIDTLPDDTGLYPVVATVENDENEIIPGMVSEVLIPEEKYESALIVPTAAIVEENEESFVYIVKDNAATKQVVTILETQSDVTAIEGEIQEGDQVVTSGQITLTDGIQVDVTGGE
ncbi:efflux RND transporter periplasmic adaptor subunit [Oceanobacillus halophilus]|uniref:Efflux RND transporter periplasmic adaptor subunit n=1 Tax=Oceanobacillus halophilus TaxID=930130 RepID=A0A495A476_9BACI|nr:efflux RND transporter periplasmic adaptor subunit [Oceanobacillus halophilus]RKQ34348.1 efflux RND transporter periplasmic adaptor subunit [Oceanobacillus halophilus]